MMPSKRNIYVQKEGKKFIIRGVGVSKIYSLLQTCPNENQIVSVFHGIEKIIRREIDEYNKRTFDSLRAEHTERADDVGELSSGASKFSVGNLFRAFLRRQQA